jgi:U3 small nucleolar RNA-associated protein 20
MSLALNIELTPTRTSTQASGAAGKGVTALLKRAPNASHPVALEGFRLLAALLRQCGAYQPTTAQVGHGVLLCGCRGL